MKILDRYLIRQFIKSWMLALGSFIVVFVIIDFFEKIGGYIDRGTSAAVIVRLYAYQLPYFTMVVLPISMLLAALFSIGRISRDNELTAMLAAGRPLIRILAPIFVMGLLISWGSYHFNDLVVTRSNTLFEEWQAIDEGKKKKSNKSQNDRIKQVFKRGEDGTLYWGSTYSVKGQAFQDLAAMQFKGPHLMEFTTAKEALWTGETWLLKDGVRRGLSHENERLSEHTHQRFESRLLPGPILGPEDFLREEKKPESMEYNELKRHIERASRSGENAERMLVDLHIKTSYPMANFIILILGAALSATRRRISLASGFGWTVGLAFIYILLLRMGLSLGHSQMLPPLLAAWVANILFLTVGLSLLARASR
jgi:lipopolysaccharide export system permease protein